MRAQFYFIWYSNIPEETIWYLHRWVGSWKAISVLLIVGKFFIPFFILIFRGSKRNIRLLKVMTIWVLFMHYIDINFILENSIVGKSINNQIKSLQDNENEKFKAKEKKLIDNEKKLISQKNILDEKQFKNQVDKHKKDLSDYRNQKKIMFDNLNKKKSEYLKKVLNSLNPIISKYVEEKHF